MMNDQAAQRRIFIASFLTLIAAGLGFGIRTKILGDWSTQFGFTKTELGGITGGGLAGFGITIILCSLFVDRVGYKPLLVFAFLLHVSSAVVTLLASYAFDSYGKDAAYNCLYYGMFLFALANGVCESVINPLVATLYPKQKTHYLNILHAGWPGGLVLGALLAYMFVGSEAKVHQLQWEICIALFLIPTALYGLITLKERFPVSEVRAAGVTLGQMLAQFVSPMLLLLLFLHACVGYVELGTDSWATNILDNIVPDQSLLLFIWVSTIMFVLRFFAGPIVHKINPLGLLFCSGVVGAIALYTLGSSNTLATIFLTYTLYALGKTFLWPTMLGVVGERFPRGGSMVMGAMGGIGMLSAGILGGPGIGYKQDYFATEKLKEFSKATGQRELSDSTYSRYVSADENSFLFFPKISGLDGTKVGLLLDPKKSPDDELKFRQEQLAKDNEARKKADKPLKDSKELDKLLVWWNDAKPYEKEDKKNVKEASLYGGQMALKLTALVPLTMAVGYLALVIYFVSQGGYKAVHIDDEPEGPAEY